MRSKKSRNHLRFHGPRLAEIREETGVSRKALAARLGLRWEIISLWESSSAPELAWEYPDYEPSASQLQDLAAALDAHPSDFLHSHEDAPASEKDEELAARKATGIRLDGDKLARMRKLRGLSYPQVAARARVRVVNVHAAESGRTIGLGALLRLLSVYAPDKDSLLVLREVVVRKRPTRR